MTTMNSPAEQRARQKADTLGTQAREAADGVARDARTAAGDAVRDVRDRIADRAGDARAAGARRIDAIAEDLERRADSHDAGVTAPLLRGAAEGAREVAAAIDSASIDDLSRAVVNAARRRPLVFTAGSFLVGFAAARFLTASERGLDRPADDERAGYDDGQPFAAVGAYSSAPDRPDRLDPSAYAASAEPIPAPATVPAPAVGPDAEGGRS